MARAELATVAAFRPWRGLQVHSPWALAKFACQLGRTLPVPASFY